MISSVSFRADTTAAAPVNFQDKIKQPQTYISKEQPAAASNISEDGKKKGSVLKTAGIVVAAAAAVAGGLALGHKFNVFEKIPAVGTYLDKAGSFITEKAGSAVNVVKDFVAKNKDKADEAAEAVKNGKKLKVAHREDIPRVKSAHWEKTV